MKTAQPLNVAIWRPVSISAHQWRAHVPSLREVSTRKIPARRFGMERGESVWSCNSESGPLSIYFEWVEINPGVVALADPMAVFSNARLTEKENGSVAARDSVIELNSALFTMDWQARVCAFLCRHREALSMKSPPRRAVGQRGGMSGAKPPANHSFVVEDMSLRQAA